MYYIKKIIPTFFKKLYWKIKSKNQVKAIHGWFGNYKTWQQAKDDCTGYDNPEILNKVKEAILKVKNGEAVYERDSVIFDKLEYSAPLLNMLKSIAKENDNKLNILDFGGSLGSTYFQYRSLLTDLNKINWFVVEQPHFVECGKKFIEDINLKFYHTIDEVLQKNNISVLFLSSVIQYFEKPYEFIDKILQYDFKYIIIDRTAFIENEHERITTQIVPEFIYHASYPAWFFNENKFISVMHKKYEIVDSFISDISKPLLLNDGNNVYWKGFILKRNNE